MHVPSCDMQESVWVRSSWDADIISTFSHFLFITWMAPGGYVSEIELPRCDTIRVTVPYLISDSPNRMKKYDRLPWLKKAEIH